MKTIDIILQVSFRLNSKNEQRKKKRLSEVSNMIGDAIDEIADIMEEEQEAFDNLPEPLQFSSKATRCKSMLTICNALWMT